MERWIDEELAKATPKAAALVQASWAQCHIDGAPAGKPMCGCVICRAFRTEKAEAQYAKGLATRERLEKTVSTLTADQAVLKTQAEGTQAALLTAAAATGTLQQRVDALLSDLSQAQTRLASTEAARSEAQDRLRHANTQVHETTSALKEAQARDARVRVALQALL